MPGARVAVVDPLPLFREGVASVLTAAGYLVDIPSDVVQWAAGDRSGVVVLTLSAQVDWQLLDTLHGRLPNHSVIALLDPVSVLAGVRAVRAGARAVLERHTDARTLEQAVAATAEGRSMVPFGVLAAVAAGDPAPLEHTHDLTDRQLSWLRRLAAGVTVAELAREVGYSERAMYRLLREMYRSMGVRSRLQAVVSAQQRGWLAGTG